MIKKSVCLALCSAIFLAACSSTGPEQSGAKVEDRKPAVVDSTAIKPVIAGKIDPNTPAALKDPNSPLYKRSVYFDFDSYVVKDEFKSLVEAHARFLQANPSMK